MSITVPSLIFSWSFDFWWEGDWTRATRMGVLRLPKGSIMLEASWELRKVPLEKESEKQWEGPSAPDWGAGPRLSLLTPSRPLGRTALGRDYREEGGRLVSLDRELQNKGEPAFTSLNQLCFPSSLLFLLFFFSFFFLLSYCPFTYSHSFIHTWMCIHFFLSCPTESILLV